MANTNGIENEEEPTVEEIYERVMGCEPLVASDDMEAWEASMNGSGMLAVARRLGLGFAIQDGVFFRKVAEDRDHALMAAGQIEAIESAATSYRELADTMSAAAMRVSVALCAHEDMKAIIEESKMHALILPGADPDIDPRRHLQQSFTDAGA